ncbi:MAG TPA: acetoacetate decarboxylase family protein [Mycobacterium sp.]|nr:acetoacetate decarboxylase family protein [Mycobacterium sp.]
MRTRISTPGPALASYDAVRDVLPSSDLHPVRWFDGRAAVLIAAMRYHEVSVRHADGTPDLLAPYGEVLIAALVTRRPLQRGLPLLLPTMQGLGGFVLDLPVTTAEACDLGRKLFGLPKFVADMDFREEPTQRQVKISEGDAEIMTLRVCPRWLVFFAWR